MAPGQLGQREARLSGADDRRCAGRDRTGDWHRCHGEPLGTGAIRIRGVLAHWADAGVLARRLGAALACRRFDAAALLAIVSRNRRRYGGYIVHAGIVVLLIGIAASSSFQTNRDVTLRPGESAVVDGRTVTYVRPTAKSDPEALTLGAVVRVEKDGEVVAVLRRAGASPPQRRAGRDDQRLLRRARRAPRLA